MANNWSTSLRSGDSNETYPTLVRIKTILYLYYREFSGLFIIGSWCNGNTTVFGTVIQGSSPCEPTMFYI